MVSKSRFTLVLHSHLVFLFSPFSISILHISVILALFTVKVSSNNGKSFTAEDVIYTFLHHLREKSESPAKAYFEQISSMKNLDSHTVEFSLAASNADFPIILSDTRAHILADGYNDFSKTTIGTGPFKVKEFKPGATYILERNLDYWGSDGPYVDEIEYVGVADPTARVNALISGDIDLLLNLDPKTTPLIERHAGTHILQTKSGHMSALAMMLDRAPSEDNNMRLAIKYALDRELILNNVYKGFGHIGNDHPISPIDPYYNRDVAQRSYDPDKARFYIKKAGMENQEIDIHASEVTGAGAIASCEVLQESARASGINLNLVKVPADAYWSSVWMKKPLCTSIWDPRPVPDLMFSIAYKGGVSYNETAWDNAQFDALLLQARATTDFEKRKAMYGEMQGMLQEDGGTSVLAFLDYLDASNNKVHGISAHPSGPLGFFQFVTNLWIES